MAATGHGSYERENYGIITPPIPDDAYIKIPALRALIEENMRRGWDDVLRDAREHCEKHNVPMFEVDSVLVLDINNDLGAGKYLGAFVYDDNMVMAYPTGDAVRLARIINGGQDDE